MTAALSQFQGVLFDVDGTLLDSNDQHAHAFVESFAQHGMAIPFETIRRLVGMGGDKLIPAAAGRDLSEALEKKIGDTKSSIFERKYLPTVAPFPAARTLLEDLQRAGLRISTATSASQDELEALLEQGGLADIFDETTSADDAEDSKPDPDIVLAAVRKSGLPKDKLVMVGDTPYDAQAARRAGVAFIGVRTGLWADKDLEGAICICEDVAELHALWFNSL